MKRIKRSNAFAFGKLPEERSGINASPGGNEIPLGGSKRSYSNRLDFRYGFPTFHSLLEHDIAFELIP